MAAILQGGRLPVHVEIPKAEQLRAQGFLDHMSFVVLQDRGTNHLQKEGLLSDLARKVDEMLLRREFLNGAPPTAADSLVCSMLKTAANGLVGMAIKENPLFAVPVFGASLLYEAKKEVFDQTWHYGRAIYDNDASLEQLTPEYLRSALHVREQARVMRKENQRAKVERDAAYNQLLERQAVAARVRDEENHRARDEREAACRQADEEFSASLQNLKRGVSHFIFGS